MYILCDTSPVALIATAKGLKRRDYNHGTVPSAGSKTSEGYALSLNNNRDK